MNRFAQETKRITGDAVSHASATKHTVENLQNSTQDISKAADVISNIAKQTNLLAINANIEAAAAGAAGKGFSVVADEVKQLALRSEQATQHISEVIGSIQQDVGNTLSAIEAIVGIINRIDNICGESVESTMAQQTASLDISRSMQNLSEANNQNLAAVSDVSQATQQTIDQVSRLQASSESLINFSQHLDQLVGDLPNNSSTQANYFCFAAHTAWRCMAGSERIASRFDQRSANARSVPRR